MIQHNLFYLLFAIFLLFTACNPSDSPDDPDKPPIVTVDSLGISVSDISFSYTKDASLIIVKTDKVWTITKTADWLSLSANTGNGTTAFIVGAAENKEFARETSILIKVEEHTKEIKLVQSGAPRITFKVNNTSFNMIYIEGGQFAMGSTNSDYNGLVHAVQLNNFYISETEVTNELWLAVKGTLPYTNNSESDKLQLPVSQTIWNTISTDFIPTLNQRAGKIFRLPTEAEWEYAALGGKKSNNYKFAGSNLLDEAAWNADNANGTKHPVKEKLPNELGLYDMSGNVSEWCSDWYDYYYGFPIVNESIQIPLLDTNPTGPILGTKKIVRGGSFAEQEVWGVSTFITKYRYSILPTGYDGCWGNTGNPAEPQCFFSENTGFRLVISL